MPLLVERLESADVDQAINIAQRADEFNGQPLFLEDVSSWRLRLLAELRSGENAHFKVIDTAIAPEYNMIAYAGFVIRRPHDGGEEDVLRNLRHGMTDEEMAIDPQSAMLDAARANVTRDGRGRGDFLQPQIYLHTLVTIASHRKRGAGTRLLRKGLELSNAEGLPMTLLAPRDCTGLYLRHGFHFIFLYRYRAKESDSALMIRLPHARYAEDSLHSTATTTTYAERSYARGSVTPFATAGRGDVLRSIEDWGTWGGQESVVDDSDATPMGDAVNESEEINGHWT